jgi:hypothetical protein
MKAYSRNLLDLTLVGVLLVLFSAGCATTRTRPPSEQHVQLVREGKETIVLLRLDGQRNGKPVNILKRFGRSPDFSLRLADLEASMQPSAVVPTVSPSRAAEDQGWIYLELVPGNYWLTLLPNGSFFYGFVDRGEYTPAPAFRLDVQGNEGVLYVGTLTVEETVQQRGLLGTMFPTAEREHQPTYTFTVRDEPEAARAVARNALEPVGIHGITTRLMVPYGEPLEPGLLGRLEPMGVGALQAGAVTGPDWVEHAMGGWMAPSAILIGAGGGGYPPSGAGAALVLGLAYAPVGALGAQIHGSVLEKKWRPFFDELGRELEQMQPNTELQARLMESFAAYAECERVDLVEGPTAPQAAAQPHLGGVLLAAVTRVEFCEGSRSGRYFIEIGFRVRLWGIAEQRWVYDRAFVYNDRSMFLSQHSSALSRPYETVLLGTSPARPIKDYCGPDGQERFRDEIKRAMDLLVDEIRHDFLRIGCEQDREKDRAEGSVREAIAKLEQSRIKEATSREDRRDE